MPGYCLSNLGTDCPGSQFSPLPLRCPKQASDIKCCTSLPREDPQCAAEGGRCVDERMCLSGRTDSRFCADQPAQITCCLPEAVPKECSAAGGSTCMDQRVSEWIQTRR